MARKRKAAEQAHNDPYDSHQIQPFLSRRARKVLRTASVPQAQNRQPRPLECVLIPVSQETRKLFKVAPIFNGTSRAHRSTLRIAPSDNDAGSEREGSVMDPRSPSPMQNSGRGVELTMSNETRKPPRIPLTNKPSDDGRRRLRRSTQRASYAESIEVSEDSADELSAAMPALTKMRGAVTKARSVSSEYYDSDDVASALTLSEDEYQSDDPVSDDLKSNESDEVAEEDSNDDLLRSKPGKRPSKRAETSGAGDATKAASRKMSKEMKNLIGSTKGLDLSLPPMHKASDIFADLTSRALPLGLDNAVRHLKNRRLKVATMCSGTESPLLAIEMIREALQSSGGTTFDIEHIFSAEIVPFKQAYIERNFDPPIIFRDIKELVKAVEEEHPTATTAYGSKAPVPTDIDIVIAGTSCVDFSRLNKKQKDSTEVGESGDTWKAVLALCRAFHPTIVILENVRTAHWDSMLQDYREAGYEPAGAYVDTKNYYIPQTRQRGYMVCFDKSRLQAGRVSTAADVWKTAMEKLQRRASCPVSSFLLPNDQIASRQLQVNENAKEVDWSRCEITQMRYRLKKRLGIERPMTKWSESGSLCPPDHSSRAWHGAQVERVLDTLDGATLRKALEGYDARFKTRIWDLSQNIHRLEDTNHFGIIGCITPSGINFVSDSWRALTPEECLLLQGIPLNRISFTVETNAEVQDLAGNAMSGPLIGSAILSSLIAGYKMFAPTPSEVDSRQQQHATEAPPRLAEWNMRPVQAEPKKGLLDITRLHKDTGRALRRCYCEGAHGTAEHMIQQCTDCRHTTCIACGGNPEHSYRISQQLSAGRMTMAAFDDQLRTKLPLRLTLANMGNWPVKEGTGQFYESLLPLTSSVFSLSSIRRTHAIRVLYTASSGRLELFLTEGMATWYLYARTPSNLFMNASLREDLVQPVARIRTGESLLRGEWECRTATESDATVNISARGERLPTWQARMHMPDFRDDWQPQFLDITSEECGKGIAGRYQYLPRCGTANDSLYKRISSDKDQPVYLFLDPTRVGPADEDCFVFAHDHAMLDYDETRQVIARVDSAWRPWKHNGGKQTTTRLRYYQWLQVEDGPALTAMSTDIVLHRPVDLALVTEESSCRRPLALMTAHVDLSSTITTPRTVNGFVQLDHHSSLSQIAWVFEAMRRELPINKWIDMTIPAMESCLECAPPKPALRWKLMSDQSIAPYEDPRTAAVYERAIKGRPSPVLVQADDVSLRFGVNLVSLAHRARSRLPTSDEKINFRWKLTTSRSDENCRTVFRLNATSGLDSCNEDLQMSIQLFPKQRMALSWMRDQESGSGKEVILEDAEEATIPSLGWRIELRAETVQYVKGGICADHPGFGKTIISLALIHSEFLRHGANTLQQVLSASSRVQPGALASSATVIVCPKLLVEQWKDEAYEKWGSAKGIFVVKEAANLAKHSIEDFKSAKLIIVSKEALAADSYVDRLAVFAAMPGPATAQVRAFAAWHGYASGQVLEHLKILKQSRQAEFKNQLMAKYRENLKSEDFVGYVPSKRLKGQAYVDAQTKAKSKTASAAKGKGTTMILRTELIGPPLFEMFFFNRVIVDEFHEFKPKEFEMVTSLRADKRWGLSGTPALSDCYDVAQIGRLLGAPLRIGSIQRGVMKQRNIKSLHDQMNSFEKFEAARTTPSNSQNGRIHELAQAFLDTFARRNLMDFDQLCVQQHLVPVTLAVSHHAIYHELSQHLNSSDMKIRKSTKSKKTDRQKQVSDAVDNSESAEEALSKAAAYPRRIDTSVSQQPSLDDWIRRREREVEQLTRELGPLLREACQKEPEEYFNWREAHIDAGQVGDMETAAIIKAMCKEADGGKTSASVEKKAKATTSEGARELTSVTNKLANRLLVSRRSVRYLQNSQVLQTLSTSSKVGLKKCDQADCHSKPSSADGIAVSGLCGHLICGDCCQHARDKDITKCQADGCDATMASHHLLWNHKLDNMEDKQQYTNHGAKIEVALDILEAIRKKRDQAVLFVQYDNQLDEVEAALSDREIPSIIVKGTAAAASQIAQFQKVSALTVIVLNANKETAAGLNLQNANHVIFLSPLLRDTQYAYDSTMAQGIGRVRRHGQKKEIHVYRVVALNTIDVDILEHRERRTDALTQQHAPDITPPSELQVQDMDPDGPKPEKTQLVKEDGKFSLRPQSWLVRRGAEDIPDADEETWQRVKGRRRVGGWEDFSSLVKFSRVFTEDDE